MTLHERTPEKIVEFYTPKQVPLILCIVDKVSKNLP